jgi:transketolase
MEFKASIKKCEFYMIPNKIRIDILDIVMKKGGHLGGSFSCVDILVCLYDNILTDNDKFILSKGHAYLALYCILKEKGLNPALSGHPDIDVKNGIECTTGSLGHGLPIAVGMALAKKLKGEKGRIFVLIGDGEFQEGTTWESINIAAHHHLDNLTLIIDNNKLQALDFTENIQNLEDLWEFFYIRGWIPRYIDGHDLCDLELALSAENENHPYVIICNTIKGKGVSYMENKAMWHVRTPTQEEYKQALKELS